MPCDRVQRELSAYLEGVLEPSEAAEVAEHLSVCHLCRQEARRQEAAWELLGTDEPEEAPADLARRVLEQVRKEERPETARVISISAWRRWVVPALAAAALVLVVFGSWYLKRSPQEGLLLAGIPEEERQVVAHLDFLEEYDLLSNLDMLENLELLENQEVVQNL